MPISLPTYKRQQFLLEFAAIKSRCPEGIYLSPAPTDPTLWAGVFFVREGPYGGAVLRFDIVFPMSYPDAGPSLSFSTEIFHPLLVPLTTYTFAAGALDPNATVSSSEAERLPPGSFNLRECFPDWYNGDGDQKDLRPSSAGGSLVSRTLDGQLQKMRDIDSTHLDTAPSRPRLIILLEYVKRAFEDVAFLDALPLRAAVNTNAWHAWRAHRGLPKLGSRPISPASADSGRTPLSPGKTPGDWNWDGVWESRVRNGTEESVSDAVLFGSKHTRAPNLSSGHVRFTKKDDDQTLEIQAAMLQALGISPS